MTLALYAHHLICSSSTNKDARHQKAQHLCLAVCSARISILSVCSPLTPFYPFLTMLRGVNSRGVGVGGSTMVHGYRMCLGGYAAWLPSVRMSHSVLLFHFLCLSPSAHLLLFSHSPIPSYFYDYYYASFPLFISFSSSM